MTPAPRFFLVDRRLQSRLTAGLRVARPLLAVMAILLTQAAGAVSWVQVQAGDHHTCATTSGGWVRCWGYNYHGQLGDGTTTSRSTAVNVIGLTSGVSAIAAGGYHTTALTSGGGVKSWGQNYDGQLGDGTNINRQTPVQTTTSGVIAVAAGGDHTCALTSGGGVTCWGKNVYGEAGNGGLTSGLTAIATGFGHTCALTGGGGVKCWGRNGSGQLGDGTYTDQLMAVNVAGLTSGVSAIAVGPGHTCALTSGGGVKCWGYNGSGQLGDGTNQPRPTAVDVAGLTSGVSAITAGGNHTCALTSGGGVKCWGGNNAGQLGDGTGTQRWTAVDVIGLTSGVIAIAGGSEHTCATTSAGGIQCWGHNAHGELGDGTTADRHTAVNVRGLTFGLTVTKAGTGSGTVSGIGINCGSDCTESYVGGDVTLTASPAVGSTFSGWSGACTGTGLCVLTMDALKAVTATFTPTTYTIATTASPAAGGSVSCTPNPVSYGGTATCTSTANTGYTFGAFSGDCTGATCTLSNVTGPRGVTATFTLNSYAITTMASPAVGGTVSCSPNPVGHGGTSTCTATASTGYTLSAFSGDCSGSTCILSNVTGPKSVTATFALNSYAIIAMASPLAGGTVSCNPNPVGHGGTSTCTATASTGYTFSAFSGDCTGVNCTLSNVSGPQSIIAIFAGSPPVDVWWDVFWRKSDGTNAIWQFTGAGPAQFLSSFPPGVPTTWMAKATGDGNGDGVPDVVWFEQSSGQVAIWLMSSPSVVGSASFPASVGAGSNWVLSGIGDVNGDGRADLVWRDSGTGQALVWLMAATGTVASTLDLGVVPLSYALRGVGDFNGDGIGDLLWFQASDGQVAVWLMTANGTHTAAFPGAVGPGTWLPYRVGDFDGDGKADLFWRDAASGMTVVWYMNGGTIADFDFFVSVPLAEWELGSVGDFDLDGRADVIWYAPASGNVVRWLMEGRHVAPTIESLPGVGIGWQMVP